MLDPGDRTGSAAGEKSALARRRGGWCGDCEKTIRRTRSAPRDSFPRERTIPFDGSRQVVLFAIEAGGR
ncbi:MAG: hypothetical protein K9J42_13095 [Sulfuritalea sp.]|nr:hypothetical protein [Sulfuritalea sp.]